MVKKNKWTMPGSVELEYDIPQGSDAVKEVRKCVESLPERADVELNAGQLRAATWTRSKRVEYSGLTSTSGAAVLCRAKERVGESRQLQTAGQSGTQYRVTLGTLG